MKRIVALIFLLPALAFGQTVPGSPTLWERALYGNKSGLQFLKIQGYNAGVTTTFEPVWPESAAYTVLAANMSTPYLASSSANDTAAGTGARTVRVTCVDSAFAQTTADYSLNGQTSVNLTQSCMVINKVEVLTAGSGGLNAGVIRIGTGANSSGVPAVVHAHVAVGLNQSQSAIYAVPADYTLICQDWRFSSKGVTAADIAEYGLDTYVNLGILKRYKLGAFENGGGNSASIPSRYKFAEKTVIVVQALAPTDTAEKQVSADCLLINDTWAETAQLLF